MKKEGLVIIIAITIIVFSAFITNFKITGYSILDNESDKIDKNVFQFLDNESEARVIVVLNEPSENKISGFVTLENDIDNYEYNIVNAVVTNVTLQDLKELQDNPNVKYVYLDHRFRAFLQDSVNIINASKVYNLQINNTNITGLNQVVCVLDTGINYNHLDLIDKVLDGYDFVNNDNDSLDDNGHGTHVAGIIAANGKIKGVAPDVNLISMKVLDSSGGGYESDIIKGLEWCYNNKDIYNISVISMSLGSSFLYSNYCDEDFLALTQAIDKITKDGIFVLAATGNNGNKTAIAAPACIGNVTSVGATSKSDVFSSFSNRNSVTDLLAPGSSINSTYGSGYAVFSGTSMATPHVAGAIVLLKQYNNSLTKTEIEDLLKETGYKINENNISYSRVDVYSAILKLESKDIFIDIYSPKNKTYVNKTIELNYSSNGEYCWYSLNKTNITLENCSNTILNLDEGSYLLRLYSNDSLNNKNSSFVSFDVNYSLIIKPEINLSSPENNSILDSNDVTFKYVVNDDYNISNCSLIINDNIDKSSDVIIKETEQNFSSNLVNGNYSWYISCVDEFNNVNSSNVYNLIVNYTAPIVTSSPSGSGGGGGGSSGGKHVTPSIVEEPKVSEIKENVPVQENNIKEQSTVQKQENNETKFFAQEVKQENIGINNKYKFLIISVLIILVLLVISLRFIRVFRKDLKKLKKRA
ncbi:MAG: S8 family peptidase [Candidatus Woesearchaeota archaeon]|nr:S8 family peptidase [Candidatus Woesearchaeota archaeon]